MANISGNKGLRAPSGNRLSSSMEPQEGLHPSGFDPARGAAAAVRRYNAALRERQAVARYLAIRATRALVRHSETPWWRLLERLKIRWAAASVSVAARDIENGKHHEDQAAWITELGQGFLRLAPCDSDRHPEGEKPEALSGEAMPERPERSEGIAHD